MGRACFGRRGSPRPTGERGRSIASASTGIYLTRLSVGADARIGEADRRRLRRCMHRVDSEQGPRTPRRAAHAPSPDPRPRLWARGLDLRRTTSTASTFYAARAKGLRAMYHPRTTSREPRKEPRQPTANPDACGRDAGEEQPRRRSSAGRLPGVRARMMEMSCKITVFPDARLRINPHTQDRARS